MIVLLALGSVSPRATAADGDLDPAFGNGGTVTSDFQHSTDLAFGVAIQADGKLVVAGTSYTNNDFSGEDFALLRYNANGTVDGTFGANGRVTTDFAGLAAEISDILVQPDGKILVAGGAFPLFVFGGDFVLARYNSNGSLDTTFGNGGIVTTIFPGQGSFASALALQPDGKILAAGTDYVNFSSDDSSNTDFALARYNPDGSLDPTFGSGGLVTTDFDGFNDDAFSVLVQPDGNLVLVGSAKNPANFYDFAAARYLANGVIDTTFGSAGKVRTDFGDHNFDRAQSAALQSDGKIIAAGFAISHNGLVQNFAVARYTTLGIPDPTFSSDGITQIDFGSCCQSANSVLLQADGKIITVGFPNSESSDADFLLARLDPKGTLDPTFGLAGKVQTSFGDLNDAANAALLQPDGKIVAVGFHPTASNRLAEFAVARYLNGAGTLALSSAVSRRGHGGAGAFDIALPLTGEPGLESRNTGGFFTMIFSFSSDVASGTAAVTTGTGSVLGTPVFAGNTMTVNLTGVADVQKIVVTLSGVTSSSSALVPDTMVSMNVLAGDVTADKSVKNADVSLTKQQIDVAVGATNFREDVNADGVITRDDVRLVRLAKGHSLP
ncbi:MAG: hypothetical protein ABI540_00220 [Spartobacteria bacterium]